MLWGTVVHAVMYYFCSLPHYSTFWKVWFITV